MGLSVPASNNASLQLAPDQVAAIAGLRGMFRQSGAIIAVSVTTAIIARSSHPGLVQAHVFVVFAILLIALLPLIRLVPDHHGNWYAPATAGRSPPGRSPAAGQRRCVGTRDVAGNPWRASSSASLGCIGIASR